MAASHPIRNAGLFGGAVALVELVRELVNAHQGGAQTHTSPPPDWQHFGAGPSLRLLMIGDSLISGAGAKQYEQGIAVQTARGLAESGFRVSLRNLARSGAVARDVRRQAILANRMGADLVVLCVGANDLRRPWRLLFFFERVRRIVADVKRGHPGTQVAMMGVPDLASVPRFGPELRTIAAEVVPALNWRLSRLAKEMGAYFVPMTSELGPLFRERPELFAEDRFHPNEDGYGLIAEHLTAHLAGLMQHSEAHPVS